jgi:hypothetical protein
VCGSLVSERYTRYAGVSEQAKAKIASKLTDAAWPRNQA